MLKILKWLFGLFAFSFIAALVAAIMIFIDYKNFLNTPVVKNDSAATFTVKSGDSIVSLVPSLERAGVSLGASSMFSPRLGDYYFRYLAKSTKRAHLLKVGEYELPKGLTPSELLDTLNSGKTIAYTLTFVEGWNFKQFRSALASASHVEQTLSGVADADIMSHLGLNKDVFFEGQFFPDTYQFHKNAKDTEILKQAHQLMQKNLQKAWAARDTTIALKTPYELLIMASLIEKETSVDSERKQISGVFHRRLSKGMKLQTDPTVIYGLGENYRGKIYKSDLKKDTPYNTYTRKGLPPTPIAMPGLASLIAAGQPDKGTSLYFVANGSGGHTFTDTYKDHRKAVSAYRKQQKKK